jgi:hypothetical protein
MGGVTLKEILKLVLVAVVTNGLFAAGLYFWATNSDFSGLPVGGWDRYAALFYFGITTFTTTGYGDVVPKSARMRLLVAAYMIAVFAGAISFLFDF